MCTHEGKIENHCISTFGLSQKGCGKVSRRIRNDSMHDISDTGKLKSNLACEWHSLVVSNVINISVKM